MKLCQMPWARNIAKTMTSNGKQFTITAKCWPLLHVIRACSSRCSVVVAGISARFSKFAFPLFRCITNHLITAPLGNSGSSFSPRISMFPETNIEILGKQNSLSLGDQSLSVKYLPCSLVYIPRYSHWRTLENDFHINPTFLLLNCFEYEIWWCFFMSSKLLF